MGVKPVQSEPVEQINRPMPRRELPKAAPKEMADVMVKSAPLPFTPTKPALPKPLTKSPLAKETDRLDSPPIPRKKKHANFGDVARMIEDIDYTRAVGRIHAKFQMLTQVDFRNAYNDAFFEKMEERRKKMNNEQHWSHILTTGTLAMGIFQGTKGIITGDIYALFTGVTLSAGGLTRLLRDYGGVPSVVGGLALGAAAFAGVGASAGAVAFTGHLPALIVRAISGAYTVLGSYITYKTNMVQSELSEIESDVTRMDTERSKTTDSIKKSLGSMKGQDMVRLSEAASALIEEHARLNQKIVHGRRGG